MPRRWQRRAKHSAFACKNVNINVSLFHTKIEDLKKFKAMIKIINPWVVRRPLRPHPLNDAPAIFPQTRFLSRALRSSDNSLSTAAQAGADVPSELKKVH